MRFLLERLYFRVRYHDQQARALASVRYSLERLGVDLEGVTDEQLITAASSFQRAAYEAGTTVEQAGETIVAVCRRLNEGRA